MIIKNKTFLVTGGASGLGRATARMIIAQQGKVLIADVNEELGEQAAEELSTKARFVKTDVTSESSVQNAIDTSKEDR